MKKHLFLLPLLGSFLLAGCTLTIGNKTFRLFEKENSQQKEENKKENSSGGEEEKDTSDFAGLTLDTAKLDEVGDSEQSGYGKLAGVSEINGVPVTFASVMTNGLNSTSTPKWSTPNDEKVQVIQCKKSEAEISVTGKIKKVTLKIYSSYDFSGTGLLSLTFNGKNVAKPTKATKTEATGCKSFNSAGDKSFDLNLFTCEYNVNADSVDTLVMKNSNTFALYLHSIVLE